MKSILPTQVNSDQSRSNHLNFNQFYSKVVSDQSLLIEDISDENLFSEVFMEQNLLDEVILDQLLPNEAVTNQDLLDKVTLNRILFSEVYNEKMLNALNSDKILSHQIEVAGSSQAPTSGTCNIPMQRVGRCNFCKRNQDKKIRKRCETCALFICVNHGDYLLLQNCEEKFSFS